MAALRIDDVRLYLLPLKTRFPFQYGIASMTEAPQIFVQVRGRYAGADIDGLGADLLPPKWFTKNPATTFDEDDLPHMLTVIRNASRLAQSLGEQPDFFHWWSALYQQQLAWAGQAQLAPLLAGFGVSLLERAVLDGVCRVRNQPISRVLRENDLGIQLGQIRDELKGLEPSDVVRESPLESLHLRHTVGLGDPIRTEDIDTASRVEDGLPQSLQENIQYYGLRYFKIKLAGDIDRDRERLRQIQQLLADETGGDARITVDGNENYRDLETFRDHWEQLRADSSIRELLDASLLVVEQPLHRDVALAEEVRDSLTAWRSAPPIILDESDADLDSVPRALALGYSGASHKNCKGIVKGLANAASLLAAKREGKNVVLTAEDLANYGPVALLQDLAIVAALGIPHVERNGHHYFAGLSELEAEEQEIVAQEHPDLFARTARGFVALTPNEGCIDVRTVNQAPFGYKTAPCVAAFREIPVE